MTYLLDSFPEPSIPLLSGTGREFIRRIGEDSARDAVLAILKGENVRAQTEFLTRARITQLNAALVAQYMTAKLGNDSFTENYFEFVKAAIVKKINGTQRT
jgi:hypothetical protein